MWIKFYCYKEKIYTFGPKPKSKFVLSLEINLMQLLQDSAKLLIQKGIKLMSTKTLVHKSS